MWRVRPSIVPTTARACVTIRFPRQQLAAGLPRRMSRQGIDHVAVFTSVPTEFERDTHWLSTDLATDIEPVAMLNPGSHSHGGGGGGHSHRRHGSHKCRAWTLAAASLQTRARAATTRSSRAIGGCFSRATTRAPMTKCLHTLRSDTDYRASCGTTSHNIVDSSVDQTVCTSGHAGGHGSTAGSGRWSGSCRPICRADRGPRCLHRCVGSSRSGSCLRRRRRRSSSSHAH